MIKKDVILDCDFAYICPKKWDKLKILDDPNKRFCESCEREVYFTSTNSELDNNRRLGRCIAANVYDTKTKQILTLAGEPTPYDVSVIYPDTVKLLILGTDENRTELLTALQKLDENKPVK